MALPFLDLARDGFSTRSAEVLAARAQHWCARTPFGLAVLRHRQAVQCLRDRRLRQGSHAWPDRVELTGTFAEFWRRSVISQEGQRHRDLRRIAQAALSDEYVLSLRPDFTAVAESLADALGAQPSFDFIGSFSEPFAGQAIAVILGRPAEEAPALARDASTLGLAMGFDAKQHEDRVNASCARLLAWAEHAVDAAGQDPDAENYVTRLLSAARALQIGDRQALVDLVTISIFGGVDTTRAQLGFAIALFAAHPDQWRWLRSNPDHIPQAIEEVIRTRPTTTWATREALEDFSLDGIEVARGETVHVLVHATGTDPEAVPWDDFDIRQRRKMHLGFGGGAHHCLGQRVARTDMACALDVLLRRWRGVRILGTPAFLPDSGNTSPVRLQVAPDWA